ncbi:MAG: hypothetical protein MUO82_04845 [Candidatus Thermoplasmatota archaeon]|nr:hypothetical protein [Candidatus Thermoplasmatota archaeon]
MTNDEKQTEKMKDEKKNIIQNYENTKDNLLESKENITKSDAKLKSTLIKIDSQIENIDKTIELIKVVPGEVLETKDHISYQLWASIDDMSTTGLSYSENLLEQTNTLKEHADNIDGVSTSSDFVFKSSVSNSYSGNRIIANSYPKVKKYLDSIKIETSHDKRREVENLLKGVNKDLSDEFNAAWESYLNITEKSHVKQTAHSMREVISILLWNLAHDEDVIKSDWFAPEKDDGKPTQRQRAKYAILGKRDEKKLTYEDLNPIYKAISNIRERYEELNPLAHERSNVDLETLKNLLEPIIKNEQDVIIALFELRKKYFSK